jgi:hypothetical protein
MSQVQALEQSDVLRDDLAGLREDQQALLNDLYDDHLLTDCYQRLLDGDVKAAMRDLLDGLGERRANSSDTEWKDFVKLCMLHPIRELVHEDPFTRRAYEKPRGYAGDAELLDFIYGVDEGKDAPPGTSELGRQVFACTTRTPACEGVRCRARWIAERVDRVAMEFSKPDLLSVASGHLREAGLSGALRQRRLGRWVAFDADIDSLQEAHRSYGIYGVETVGGTVRQMLSGKKDLGQFDFIYSTGLYDYLRQSTAKRLTTRLFNMLRPQGHLVVANFLTGIEGRGYMESLMDWNLIYRNHSEMLDMAMALDQTRVRDIHLTVEDAYNVVFLHVTKRK